MTLKSGGLCSALGSEIQLLFFFLFKPSLGDPIPPDAQGSAQPLELKKSLKTACRRGLSEASEL